MRTAQSNEFKRRLAINSSSTFSLEKPTSKPPRMHSTPVMVYAKLDCTCPNHSPVPRKSSAYIENTLAFSKLNSENIKATIHKAIDKLNKTQPTFLK